MSQIKNNRFVSQFMSILKKKKKANYFNKIKLKIV